MRAGAVILCAFVVACAPRATLELSDGTTYSGRPLRKDDSHILIETRDGRYVLCKNDVRRVTYGGQPDVLAGGLLLGLGASLLASSTAHRTGGEGSNGLAPIEVALVVGGSITFLAGSYKLSNSIDATGLPASPEARRTPCTDAPRYVGPSR